MRGHGQGVAITEAWLEVCHLACRGRHGVFPEEREQERLFRVDLAVKVAIDQAARTDHLDDTVDFVAIAATVQEVVAGKAQALLETVAVQAGSLVLARFPAVSALRLRLAKPFPPGLEAEEEAVQVHMQRA